MIKRIVSIKLKPEAENTFLEIFRLVKDQIRSQKGCLGLELLRHQDRGETSLWTISFWQSEGDLETYRNSELFLNTWSAVKPLFTAKAEAWTLIPIESIE